MEAHFICSIKKSSRTKFGNNLLLKKGPHSRKYVKHINDTELLHVYDSELDHQLENLNNCQKKISTLSSIKKRYSIRDDNTAFPERKKYRTFFYNITPLTNFYSENICFLNSAIQLLMGIPEFVTICTQKTHNKVCILPVTACFLCTLEVTVNDITCDNNTYSLNSLAHLYATIDADYIFQMQYDPFIVLSKILELYKNGPLFPRETTYFENNEYRLKKLTDELMTSQEEERLCLNCSYISTRRQVPTYFPAINDLNEMCSIFSDTKTFASFSCTCCKKHNTHIVITRFLSFSKYCLVKIERAKRKERAADDSFREFKDITKVSIPEISIINNQQLIPISWINHTGYKPSSGHYFTCRKIHGTYIQIDDTHMTTISKKKTTE